MCAAKIASAIGRDDADDGASSLDGDGITFPLVLLGRLLRRPMQPT